MASRGGKLLVTLINVYVAYVVALDAYLPYRVRTDEMPKVLDVRHLLEANQLYNFVYFAGQYHQIQTSMLLRVTGLEVAALQILSPFLGGVMLGVIALVCYQLHRLSTDDPTWWGFAPGVVSIVVFAGFVNRARETSHKGYLFLLVFLALLLVGRLHLRRPDWRTTGLLVVVIASIGMLNYFWGAVFTTFLFGALVMGDVDVRRHGTAILVLLSVFLATLPFDNPLSRFPVEFVTAKLLTLLSVGTGGVETSAGSKIAQWPTIELLGLSLNSWFVWWSGVVIIGLISALATVTAGLRYLKDRDSLRPLGRMVIGFNVVAFGVVVALMASGNLTIVRRIVPYIGILSTVYWGSLYSGRGPRWEVPLFLADRRLTVLRFTLAVLVVTAVLGVPRSIDNGTGPPMESPIDHYIDDHEVARYEFLERHGVGDEGCRAVPVSEIPYQRVAQQVAGTKVVIVSRSVEQGRIYDSGPRGSLLCPRARL